MREAAALCASTESQVSTIARRSGPSRLTSSSTDRHPGAPTIRSMTDPRKSRRSAACPGFASNVLMRVIGMIRWSGRPHGRAADDTNPVYPPTLVTHELNRLATVGPVGDDQAVGPIEEDRGFPDGAAAARAILHQQSSTLGPHHVRIARPGVGAQVWRRIGLGRERFQRGKRLYQSAMRDGLIEPICRAQV